MEGVAPGGDLKGTTGWVVVAWMNVLISSRICTQGLQLVMWFGEVMEPL